MLRAVNSSTDKFIFFIAILVAVFLVYLINKSPYFPGDVVLAQTIQHVLPANIGWAIWVSGLASFPTYFILLAISFFMAWIGSGLRAGVLAFVSFGGLWLLDKVLRLFVFQARPSEELISVPLATHGSAFPSTAAIIYSATFGYLFCLSLYKFKNSGLKFTTAIISGLALITVSLARIELGAHWPSDILVTFLLGAIWIYFLLSFIHAKKGKIELPLNMH